ncbi:antitoxin Xre/MbcA/ParS toxin-binding domain-containing protein [Bradyrhizobium uaiense]|uniref:DUF2384 domain-containing protein n=1 Tax=Bradyrhizobium uaiense TaxID=2594946 RepID=A0A6P1BKK6_9BRAD|nr:antitoxin Xre/MbcA/ParS toxin-binding domain-containing protein [Bradyrhizobium uaiense]NEU98878.1 DUF2384 domain-containing protein [Bradyrhizobium uaiense]
MSEKFEIEIEPSSTGSSFVVVTDMASGRRLSGSTMLSALDMIAILIEDHRERREADPVDQKVEAEKQRRRHHLTQRALSVFDSALDAKAWLMTPTDKLGGRRPLAVAGSSDSGLTDAEILLGQLTKQAASDDGVPEQQANICLARSAL